MAKKIDKYSSEVCRREKSARKPQIEFGFPNSRDFIDAIETGTIQNRPIDRDDIIAAKKIFGPNIASLM